MRSLTIIAALSFASIGLAQDDAPEAPPLHPPKAGDDSDSATTTTTTTKTSTSSTKEAESTTIQPGKPSTEELETTTTKAPSEYTTIEPDTSSALDMSLTSTETLNDGFVTVRTETPAQGTPTETSLQPVVTGAAPRLGTSLVPGWAAIWGTILAAALY
ncbi:hypothetical protein LIA77_00598 [Sarocladium implicatum]|nr:hypothetical protein LIA77_00598 [Sarocladium implicatum]